MIFMIFFFSREGGFVENLMSARKWITLFPCVTLSSRVPFTLLLKSIRVNDRESHSVKQTTLAVVGFCETKNHYEFLHTYSRMVVTVLLFLVFICFLSQEMILQIMPNGVP